MHERRILGTELLWAFGVGVLIAATLSMVVFTALTMGMNPPSNVREGTARPCRYPEKACPGPDPGWVPVFGKDHAPAKSWSAITKFVMV
jgi:hypothetical protein